MHVLYTSENHLSLYKKCRSCLFDQLHCQCGFVDFVGRAGTPLWAVAAVVGKEAVAVAVVAAVTVAVAVLLSLHRPSCGHVVGLRRV